MGNVKNNNLRSNNLRSAWLSDGDTIASKPSRPRLYRPRKRLGRCYELAYNYLHKDDRFVRWRLVHGEIAAREDCLSVTPGSKGRTYL